MRKLLLSTAIALSTIGSPAFAAQTDVWAHLDPWTIRVDHTAGNGCFMDATYPTSNTYLRIGIDNRGAPQAYMMIANPKWTSSEQGKLYSLDVKFDDGQTATWKGQATLIGKTPTLVVDFDPARAIGDTLYVFGVQTGFRLFYEGREIASLRLNGTAKAAVETYRCQKAQAGAPKDDPFSRPAQSSSDFWRASCSR